ncbi:triacylglycerol lipase [Streptomyces sp. NK08204]|uniref:esterase/lipase family protein n=1 Tax=Streptomyces sp. NK08204 TaxID=2873260 RepID=UPI001CED5613|nr:GPI inositol-deacylase [Streptomyces sp. NK08204]
MPAEDVQSEASLGSLTLSSPLTTTSTTPLSTPSPYATWELPFGKAWVHLNADQQFTRPVLIADGFELGASDHATLYNGLNDNLPDEQNPNRPRYHFLDKLKDRGRAVVLIGFNERSASLLDNAKAIREAVIKANAENVGGTKLMVGGFSMGGILARYALAKMETDGETHGTEVYFSYDSPHRGAVIPIGLQAFAAFIPNLAGQAPDPNNDFYQYVNSPAAQQMLAYYYDHEKDEVGLHPLRQAFLDALQEVDFWPRQTRRIGVANGTGNGVSGSAPAGQIAVQSTGQRPFPGTTFYLQSQGETVQVALLRRYKWTGGVLEKTVTTSGLPELDGAPGGTLASYGLVAKKIVEAGGEVELHYPAVCFVPSVSAVDVREVTNQEDLYTPADSLAGESQLHEFRCASTNTLHTSIVPELCEWLLERLPE